MEPIYVLLEDLEYKKAGEFVTEEFLLELVTPKGIEMYKGKLWNFVKPKHEHISITSNWNTIMGTEIIHKTNGGGFSEDELILIEQAINNKMVPIEVVEELKMNVWSEEDIISYARYYEVNWDHGLSPLDWRKNEIEIIKKSKIKR